MSDVLTSITQRARGKSALYDLHPELTERVPLFRSSSESQSGDLGLFEDSGEYYRRHPWVYKAVSIIANNIAPLRPRVVKGKGGETKEVEGAAVTQLLDNPNDEMSAADLHRQWAIDMQLGGEEGWEIVRGMDGKKVLSIWPRQPQHFTVRPVPGGMARYRRIASYSIDDGMGAPYNLEPKQFIHFKFHNPLSIWRGLAPITAARMSIILDTYAQVWTRLFFKNQARPDYALIAPEGLTPGEREEYERKLTTRFGMDSAGVGKPIILEDGVTDIKVFSFPPKDLEWVEQRGMARDEIGAIFGVPDEIMGYGKDTYENFGTAERVLWSLTIVSILGVRDSALTRWFRRWNMIGAEERIETDLSGVASLREDLTSKVTQWRDLVQNLVPPNAANDVIGLGLPDLEGGDISYMSAMLVPGPRLPGAKIPEDMVPPEPPPAAPPPPAGNKPQAEDEDEKPAGGEKPADGELPSTDAGPDEEPPAGQGAAEQGVVKSAAPEFGSPQHEAIWKSKDRRTLVISADMRRKLKSYFQRQQNEVGRQLRNNREIGRGKFKADGIPPVDQLFDLEDEVRRFIEEFAALIKRAVLLVGSSELSDLIAGGEFDPTNPAVVAGIRHVLETVARKVNDTTWEGLVDTLQEAERAGEGTVAMMERISAYFGGRKSDWETERIARTTMTGAAGVGDQSAREQSGVVKGKTWISALLPDRTRDAHAAAHGQTVGLNEMFNVGGEALAFPGDPNASPSNIINCLCTTIADVEE